MYATIRREAFGEEIGQFSWLTADEYRRFFALLEIDAGSEVLEAARGLGGSATFMAPGDGLPRHGPRYPPGRVDAA